MLIPENQEQQQNNKPKRVQVPANPARGVEVKVTKFEHFSAQGNTLEKVIITTETADEVPHYIDIVAPTPAQVSLRINEITNLSKEFGLNQPEKWKAGDDPSFEEFCRYYLEPGIGAEGRVKVVYQSNKVVFNPSDPNSADLVGKPIEEIKRLRKPYTKTGKAPYFYGKGNDKDFVIVSKGDKWDDFVDYTVEIKAPDADFSVPAPASADLPF